MALSGCAGFGTQTGINYGVKVIEEKEGCRFSAQGLEHVDTTQPDLEGCFRWDGERCSMKFGTNCE